MTATSTLIDTSDRRLYQMADSATTTLPSSGSYSELNLTLSVLSGNVLTETDIEFSSVAVGGGFSVDALDGSTVVGQFPVQVIQNGPVSGHPDQWQFSVVLFADDLATIGVGTADHARLNGVAYFLVSPLYAKF